TSSIWNHEDSTGLLVIIFIDLFVLMLGCRLALDIVLRRGINASFWFIWFSRQVFVFALLRRCCLGFSSFDLSVMRFDLLLFSGFNRRTLLGQRLGDLRRCFYQSNR